MAARAAQELDRRETRQACSTSLLRFIEEFWPIVEPVEPFVKGWAIEAICEHLEAVSYGQIKRLLINVPPGYMKSLATDVFFPAWEWGPRGMPSMRYVTFSYSSGLTERDNGRFAAVLSSQRYRELWGKEVPLPPMLGATKVKNLKTGWKLASSVHGVGTGERGNRVILDDPHNIKESESEAIRTETVRWFREAMSNRLNNPLESAIIVIMQRVHEEDVSGTILANDFGYDHLCIPEEFDWARPATSIGWTDPRTEEGDLAFPERFPKQAIETEKITLGPTAYAAQHQQTPTPRGGNIIQSNWWKLWPPDASDINFQGADYDPDQYPPVSLVVGSVDTAYGEKDENAYNAMTTWVVWHDRRERPQAMLMHAWRKRLPLRGVIPDTAKTDPERRPYWGLAEHVANSVRRLGIDVLLIEDKTRGNDLRAELVRLLRPEECQIVMIQPKVDKVARLHAVQALFAAGMVWAPEKAWAQMVIDEVCSYPKSKYADLTDTTSQALTYMRRNDLLLMAAEADEDWLRRNEFKSQRESPYDV